MNPLYVLRELVDRVCVQYVGFQYSWSVWEPGNFVNRLGYTSVYPKLIHVLNALMGSVSKALMDEFIIDIVDHSRDAR